MRRRLFVVILLAGFALGSCSDPADSRSVASGKGNTLTTIATNKALDVPGLEELAKAQAMKSRPDGCPIPW